MNGKRQYPNRGILFAPVILIAAIVAVAPELFEKIGVRPFSLDIYEYSRQYLSADFDIHTSGCLIERCSNDICELSAWAPSFTISVTKRNSQKPIKIEIENVLSTARLGDEVNVKEFKSGTIRVVEIPPQTGSVTLKWSAVAPDRYSFAVTGDIGGTKKNLNAMSKGVDFIIVAGDLVSEDDQTEHLTAHFETLDVPVYAVIGNHDIEGARMKEYLNNVSPLNYSFNYGLSRFIFYNNASESLFGVESESAEYLGFQLLHDSSPLTFVVMHKPLFQDMKNDKYGTRYPKPRYLASKGNTEHLMNLFHFSDVVAVFSGHIHEYHRWNRNGIEYVISGEGKKGLLRRTSRYARVDVVGANFSISDEQVEH